MAFDVETQPQLGNAQVATYATAIREGSETNGRVLGVLVIFFDWAPQAAAVVKGVRLSDEEWTRTRCLIVDAAGRVIASSDGRGVLQESFRLRADGRPPK